MRIGRVLEKYSDKKTFQCKHCGEVTTHSLLKVKETKIEPERKDSASVLLVWFCEYCLDSERLDRLNERGNSL
jgi:hypothetical protein